MRTPRTVPALAVVLALVAAACGPTVVNPSPGTSGQASQPPSATSGVSLAPTSPPDPEEIYQDINDQVQVIRGLDEQEAIEPTLVSPDEMAEVLEDAVRENSPPEQLAAYERLYKGMDLLEPDQSLADLYVDLLKSQVAGLYDPASESLYVKSREGRVGSVERLFYAHEYQHALQDQHFDLQQIQEGLTDQTDRQLARQALVEGDAYLLMSLWLFQNMTAADIADIQVAASDPEAAAVLQRIPPIIREQILFAAIQGLLWTQQIFQTGGWEAVNQAFAAPPDSTEQVLHADKWESREPPIEVAIEEGVADEMGLGWSETMRDTFGERQLGVWLGNDGTAAAAGWGGDRLVFLEGPSGAWGIALVTEWDAPAEATEFADAAVLRHDAAGTDGAVVHQPGSTRVTLLFASDAGVATSLDGIFGNTGV